MSGGSKKIFPIFNKHYDTTQIATWNITRSNQITFQRLSNMMFIFYGCYLAVKKERLFAERFQVWHRGIILPSIYGHVGLNFNSIVSGMLVDIDHNFPSIKDGDIIGFLVSIWNHYSRFTDEEIIILVHQPGTPWADVWQKLKNGSTLDRSVDDECIEKYYCKFIKQKQKKIIKFKIFDKII